MRMEIASSADFRSAHTNKIKLYDTNEIPFEYSHIIIKLGIKKAACIL